MAFTGSDLSVTYNGNGSTGPYPITFHFDPTQPTEVKVRVTDGDGVSTDLTYTTDYFVDDGNVYTVGSYSASNSILIYRDTQQVQEVDIRDGDPVRAYNMEERGLDRLVMMVQELKGRGVLAPGYEMNQLSELAAAASRANKLLSFDGDGDLSYTSVASLAATLEWDVARAYGTDDLVYYGGYFWKALQASTGETPAENAYWTVYKGEKGDTGDTGPTGPQGPEGSGVQWDSSKTYDANDIVAYNGVLYISLQGSNTNQQPDTATTYWSEYLNSSVPTTPYLHAATSSLSQNAADRTETVIQWNWVLTDTHSAFDTGTYEYEIPEDGLYHIDASVLSSAVTFAAGEYWVVRILVNGNILAIGDRTESAASVTTYAQAQASKTLSLSQGDLVSVAVYHTQGGSVAIYSGTDPEEYNYFTVARVDSEIAAVQGEKGDAGIGVEWDSGTTYPDGSIVSYGTKLYQSLQGSNLNKQPDTESSWWTEADLNLAAPVIDFQYDDTSYSFGTTMSLGPVFDAITLPAGAQVIAEVYAPVRNNYDSWGGGYHELQYRIDGGSWLSCGTSGYSLIMTLSGDEIGHYNNSFYFDFSDQTSSFTVQFRWYMSSYQGTLILNGGNTVNGKQVGTSGSYAQNHYYAHMIVREISKGPKGEKGDAGVGVSWDSGTSYAKNDVVSYGTALYRSLQGSNTNKQPDTETSWWEQVNLNPHAWDSSVTYASGDHVMYNNVLYESIQASNTGNQPDAATTYWTALNLTSYAATGGYKITNVLYGRDVTGETIWNWLYDIFSPSDNDTDYLTDANVVLLIAGANGEDLNEATYHIDRITWDINAFADAIDLYNSENDNAGEVRNEADAAWGAEWIYGYVLEEL